MSGAPSDLRLRRPSLNPAARHRRRVFPLGRAQGTRPSVHRRHCRRQSELRGYARPLFICGARAQRPLIANAPAHASPMALMYRHEGHVGYDFHGRGLEFIGIGSFIRATDDVLGGAQGDRLKLSAMSQLSPIRAVLERGAARPPMHMQQADCGGNCHRTRRVRLPHRDAEIHANAVLVATGVRATGMR